VDFTPYSQSHMIDWDDYCCDNDDHGENDDDFQSSSSYKGIKLHQIPPELWEIMFSFWSNYQADMVNLVLTSRSMKNALMSCSSIWRNIKLSDFRVKNDPYCIFLFFNNLVRASQVRSLDILAYNIDRDDIEQLVALMPYVTRFSVMNNPHFSAAACSSLVGWKYLEEASFTSVPITPQSLKKIADSCPNFSSIALFDCKRVKDSNALSDFFSKAKSLRKLKFRHPKWLTMRLDNVSQELTDLELHMRNMDLGQVIQKFPRLRYAQLLGGNEMRGSLNHDNLEVLIIDHPLRNVSINCSKLKELQTSDFDDACIKKLPELEILKVSTSGNQRQVDTILQQCKKLKELHFTYHWTNESSLTIRSDTLEYFRGSAGNIKIESNSMKSLEVSPSSVLIVDCPNLSHLTLGKYPSSMSISSLKLKELDVRGAMSVELDLPNLVRLHVSNSGTVKFDVRATKLRTMDVEIAHGPYPSKVKVPDGVESLETLNIRDTQPIELASLLNNVKRISNLNISGCHTVKGLECLSKVEHLMLASMISLPAAITSSLQSLSVNSLHLTLENPSYLDEISACENLESLSVVVYTEHGLKKPINIGNAKLKELDFVSRSPNAFYFDCKQLEVLKFRASGDPLLPSLLNKCEIPHLKELEIDMNGCELPSDGFDMPSLTRLEVTGSQGAMVLTHLPMLKTLVMRRCHKLSIDMKNDESNIYNEALTDIELFECEMNEASHLLFSSSSVKNIRVRECTLGVCPILLHDLPYFSKLSIELCHAKLRCIGNVAHCHDIFFETREKPVENNQPRGRRRYRY